MSSEIIKKIDWHGHMLSLSTNKVARHADGGVITSMGDTVVLTTVVFEKKAKNDIDFFPLGVYYREMFYAAGRIPGGFNKEEGSFSKDEKITARLIDRAIRPLFDPNFLNETQITCTVLSYDPRYSPDILAIIGSSAALAISGAPIIGSVAATRIGLIDDKFILNPSYQQIENNKKLDLVVASTTDSVTMVDSQSYEISEEKMLDAIKFGFDSSKPVIEVIKELKSEIKKESFKVTESIISTYINQIEQEFSKEIKLALLITCKPERENALQQIEQKVIDHFENKTILENRNIVTVKLWEHALKHVKSKILRNLVLQDNKRIDGRKLDEIRPITCEVGFLNRVHGSALFTRGETQSLVTVTLGSTNDEQIVEKLGKDERQHFLLDYIFPAYSVGEVSVPRPASRREIGHARLARKAIEPVIPNKEHFPYTIRVVSEITESNGSSSMATICGASLSIMDAGIPIKTPVAGIAMGLIKSDDKFEILSDIIGYEDYLGDMDFKVAGTNKGITALQLDVKVPGINFEMIAKTFEQAKKGRQHILKIMENTIDKPRKQLSPYAPIIEVFKITKDKIRDVIGLGGKVIKEICKSYNVEIDISEDGTVKVCGIGVDNVRKSIQNIQDITFNPEIGDLFNGTVVKIIESGAFINYLGNRDGFVHISEINNEHIKDINDHLQLGDKVKVKFIGSDKKGRMRLSLIIDEEKSTKEIRSKDNEKISSTRKVKFKSIEEATVSERKYFN